ncbi:MAG: class I SAM-dependent methyltransferase [Acidimicrobiales bacterium]
MRNEPTSALVRGWLRSRPRLWRRLRATRLAIGRRMPPRAVEGVDGPVHPNDLMLRGRRPADVAHYRSVADTVLAALDRHAPGWDAGAPVLDVGCGYGRLTRRLVQRVDPALVTVNDIDADAVSFCASAFGVVGADDLGRLRRERPASFGTIVLLTVLTNVDASAFDDLLDSCAELLAPGGVLLVTTHGATAATSRVAHFGAAVESRHAAIADDLERHGISFHPYRHGTGALGLTWHAAAFVVERAAAAGLELVALDEAALDGVQDVWVLRRPETAADDRR